ncbi:glycosyltransferase family 4 protein [Paenibacillus sp. sgz500958]|uniref:glycosyltransferase family 4 protein n=1 Tax=Paenibacillus sp. sgz500958 TaxID=3242475 RepID=UPI0036D412E8
MHICMIAPEQFAVPGSNSVEICMLAIAGQLALRHKVTLVSRRIPGLPLVTEHEGVHIVRLPADSPSVYLRSVISYVEHGIFDIIQVDNRPHLMAAVQSRIPHIPVVLFLHSLTFVPDTPATALSLDRASLIIANSRSLERRLARRFPRKVKDIRVVTLGADLDRFTPVDPGERLRLRRIYGLPTETFTVLFVGRLIPRKGVPLLIRAVHTLRGQLPVRLIIAGRGKPDYVRRLKKLSRQLRVPSTFLGNVSHEEIHQLYQAADCFVCPSQRHESFGLVNVEAMASGLPVIASNNGGIREIIVSGINGYLVDRYREPRVFSTYLLRLGRSPKLARRIGSQGREDALRNFAWSHTAFHLESIYQRLLPHRQEAQDQPLSSH